VSGSFATVRARNPRHEQPLLQSGAARIKFVAKPPPTPHALVTARYRATLETALKRTWEALPTRTGGAIGDWAARRNLRGATRAAARLDVSRGRRRSRLPRPVAILRNFTAITPGAERWNSLSRYRLVLHGHFGRRDCVGRELIVMLATGRSAARYLATASGRSVLARSGCGPPGNRRDPRQPWGELLELFAGTDLCAALAASRFTRSENRPGSRR